MLIFLFLSISRQSLDAKNYVLRRPDNGNMFRPFRQEWKLLQKNLQTELFFLLKSYSTVFGKTIVISKLPSEDELKQILENFQKFKEQATPLTSKTKLDAATQAITACSKLSGYLEELEKLKREDLSPKDFEDFNEHLRKNVFLQLTKDATLENVGEFLGGVVAQELPATCNPASYAGALAKDYVFGPLGKLSGLSLSLLGITTLIEKLPVDQIKDHKRLIQILAIVSLLGLEYCGMNPISNVLQEYLGELGGDLGVYSISLLFNYVGMLAFGSQEKLGDYARKMTPSMLVYNGAGALLEYLGLHGLPNFLISFYLSHIAYNYEDIYKPLFQGTLLSDMVDLSKLDSALSEKEVTSACQALTKLALITVSQRLGIDPSVLSENQSSSEFLEKIKDHLSQVDPENKALSLLRHSDSLRLLELDPIDLSQYVTGFSSKSSIKEQTQKLKTFAWTGLETLHQNLDSIRPEHSKALHSLLTQTRKELARIKQEDLINEGPFLIREFNDFCEKLRESQMNTLLERYKEALTLNMNQPIATQFNAGNEHSKTLAKIKKEIIQELLKDFSMDKASIATLVEILDHCYLEHSMFSETIEGSLNERMSKLSPLVPKPTMVDATCSFYMQDLLSKAFLLQTMLRLKRHAFGTNSFRPLDEKDKSLLLRNLTDLIMRVRHPNHLSLIADARKRVFQSLINSQV